MVDKFTRLVPGTGVQITEDTVNNLITIANPAAIDAANQFRTEIEAQQQEIIDGFELNVDAALEQFNENVDAGIVAVGERVDEVDQAGASAILSISQAETSVQVELSQAIERIEQDGRDAAASTGWFVVGDFADGFTFTARNQVGRDSTGELWSYNGELPFVVAPTTVPSDPDYTLRGDAALRSDLANESQGASIVKTKTSRSVEDTLRRPEIMDSFSYLKGKELQFSRKKKQAVVSFIDDDGRLEVMTKLKPLYDSKGITAGFNVIVSAISNSANYMTWHDCHTLVDSGWEIMSHLVDNVRLDEVTDEQAEYQLSESRKLIEAKGFVCESFVPPYGVFGNDNVQDLIRNYYRSAYVTNSSSVQTNPLRHHRILRKDAVASAIENNPTLQQLKDWVDEAIATDSYLVFTTHAAYAGFTTEQQTVIGDLIDYIQAQGVPILNPTDALNLVGNHLEIGDAARDSFGNWLTIDADGKMWPEGFGEIESAGSGKSFSSTPDEFKDGTTSIFISSAAPWNEGGAPLAGVVLGVLETIKRVAPGGQMVCYQTFTYNRTARSFFRAWNDSTSEWSAWKTALDGNVFNTLVGDGDSVIGDYPLNAKTVSFVPTGKAGFPTGSSAGLLETTAYLAGGSVRASQSFYAFTSDEVWFRTGSGAGNQFNAWKKLLGQSDLSIRTFASADVNNAPNTFPDNISISGFTNATASTNGMPENSGGTCVTYRLVAQAYMAYQTYHILRSNRMYMRHYNDTGSEWGSWVLMAGGATGTFTTADSKTVTVTNGIITAIT